MIDEIIAAEEAITIDKVVAVDEANVAVDEANDTIEANDFNDAITNTAGGGASVEAASRLRRAWSCCE